MQTVTLAIPTAALTPFGLVPPELFEKFEELELLETLWIERRWRLQVLRLRSTGTGRRPGDLARRARRVSALYNLESLEVLGSSPATRDIMVLVRQRNPDALEALLEIAGGKVFPGRPFILRRESTLATFRGEPATIRTLLRRLRALGLPFELKGVRRTPSTPSLGKEGAATLTPLQERVLAEAVRRGYYTIPRRTTLTELARSLRRSPAAVGKALRRAEGALALQAFPRDGEPSGPDPSPGPRSS